MFTLRTWFARIAMVGAMLCGDVWMGVSAYALDKQTEAEARAAGHLVGHGGPVKAIAVSPDGASAVSGSFDYSMIHWNLDEASATTDPVERRFDDHDGAVNAVAYLPDGQRVVAAGDDGGVKVWDLVTGKALHTFTGHTGKVLALDVSADGRWAATASWDGTVRLWDLQAGKPGPVLKGHRGPVNGVVLHRDGKTVFSAGYDGQIGRWSLARGELDRMIYKHGWGLNVLKALPGGKQLVFGSLNGAVGLVDVETGVRVRDLSGHERPVLSMSILDKPGLLATGGGDGIVRVYRLGDWKLLEEHRNPYGPVWAMDFGKSGATLYYAGLDDFVTRWQVSPRKAFEKVTSQFPRRFQVGREVSLGERQFARKCSVCHTLKKDGRNRAGPTLYKVFGRKIGTVPGYPYSDALANGDIIWNAETLSKLFTLGPEHYTPGTKMPLQKITDPKKINALIAYLKVASDDAQGTSSAPQ